MQDRNVGRSGLRVSIVGLGCNSFGGRIGPEVSHAVIHRALDSGITFFDTADVYANTRSEEVVGEALEGKRGEVVLATKFGLTMQEPRQPASASRQYIIAALERSLRRLRTDWIDLYQLHVPDPRTPIEETIRALDDLVRQGKVRYFGCSNMPAWQVVEGAWTAAMLRLNGFVSCQAEYNVLSRDAERELVPALRSRGMGLLPYFPLAGGLLTGKYRRDEPPPPDTRLAKSPRVAHRFMNAGNMAVVDALKAFAEARGRTLTELAFSWLCAKPEVACVMAGATRPEQVVQNVSAVQWRLNDEEIGEIDRIAAAADVTPVSTPS
jgi:aryl-alcohol dehydrogenase-like predicted oxidoreductase